MSTVIVHRPSAATRAFVNAIEGINPAISHLQELAAKPELTECESLWVRHELSKHVIETVPV